MPSSTNGNGNSSLSGTMGSSDENRSMFSGGLRNRNRTNKSGSMLSSANTQATQHRPDHIKSKARAIQTTRILLCLSLLILAAVLGACVNIFFRKPEVTLAKEQFESIAGRATAYAKQTTRLKRLGVITMATTIGVAHPNADTWPFVWINGYDEISSNLVETVSGDGMGFAPLVEPDLLAEFEDFAYDSYSRMVGYPNTTAVSDFGRGVWAKDNKNEFGIEEADQKYHEGVIHPNGETSWGSSYEIFAPILQHSDGADAKPLMLNLHNEKRRGQTIDSIMDCSQDVNATQCGQLTDLLLLTQRQQPASLIMQPIFPANDTKMTGIVSTPLVWEDVLVNAFGSKVKGIDCVLTSSTGITHTYKVDEGNIVHIGEGDQHDSKFDSQIQSVILTNNEEADLYSESSFQFVLELYPTEEFVAIYRSKNPLYGALLIAFVMIFLIVIFFLYDWYVRGEFTFKNELLEAKRNFIRFVSHEVRTPLNAVCMGLMLMREELEKAMKDSQKISSSKNESAQPVSVDGLSEWKGVTDEILENSQNAVDVLNDLLNYDKITTGSLQLELSLLGIDMLMDHAQKEFKLPAAKKHIDVVFEDTTDIPYKKEELCIVGDDVRLIQVLRNLMSNALKFTPKNGKVTVTLSWISSILNDQQVSNLGDSRRRRSRSRNGSTRRIAKRAVKFEGQEKFKLKKGEKISLTPTGYLQLHVADTGAGMSQDQMVNVFDQGTQFNVNELQAGQGSGLGLYIAKGIMDQHLGSLTVSSEGLNKGTVFTMTIPVYRDVNQGSEVEDIESSHFNFKAAKAKAVPEEGVSNLRILVVDDSDTNRKFLSRILQNRGHTCDQARDGKEAVALVSESMKDSDGASNDDMEAKHYDAVLLDYEMPVMNGPTAAKELRGMGSDTFIVGITGNLLPEDVEYFRSQGANEVLPKPFNISDLEELLMEYGVGFRGK